MSGTANHLLHAALGSEGYWLYRLTCIDGACPGTSFSERTDPDCRCEPKCEYCANDDHGGCSRFGGYIANIGTECQCDVDTDECWTTLWLAEEGGECIHGDDWPEDGPWPMPVHCEWHGDGLGIHYAPAQVTP